MWTAVTRDELIIEVWEKLDCESIGQSELDAIEIVLRDRYGPEIRFEPLAIARLLADEGAELRHAELMRSYIDHVGRELSRPELLDLEFGDLSSARRSLSVLEGLRQRLVSSGDDASLNRLKRRVVAERRNLAGSQSAPAVKEIAEWLMIWLQTPEMFDAWLALRTASADFIERFGPLKN